MTTHPINSYVVKVASRCNLACSYCYEFFAHDQSWKTRKSQMSPKTGLALGKRIAEHARDSSIKRVTILLHGGEPLLLGVDGLKQIVSSINQGVNNEVQVDYGIQTNGILVDKAFLDWALQDKINVGVSCDGTPGLGDSRRVDHTGKASGEDLEKALKLLKGHPSFSGLLSVINPSIDPLATWKYLSSWDPPLIDFLLPHHTWEAPPYDLTRARPIYGEWFVALFDEWFTKGPHQIRIRYFEELISRSMGSSGTLESLGEEPVSILVINVDGEYEGVDSLKASRPNAWVTGMNIFSNKISDVFQNELISLRQSGALQLADKCKSCHLRKPCGGGYLPHRYHRITGFKSPSVFCADIMLLANHIQQYLTNDLSHRP